MIINTGSFSDLAASIFAYINRPPEFLQTRVTLASLLVDAGAANEALETLAPVVDVPTAPVMMFEILTLIALQKTD